VARKRKTIREDNSITLGDPEYNFAFNAALKLVGFENPKAKLAWLFGFLETDLQKLSQKEQRVCGECVRQLASAEHQSDEGYSSFLVGDELAEYQKIISEGIKSLFRKPIGLWTIAPPEKLQLELFRKSPITSRGARFQLIMRGDKRTGILYGVM